MVVSTLCVRVPCSGPMMEEYFFGHWSERRPSLPQIYLPIGWSTYFFSAARVTFNASEVTRAKLQACPPSLTTYLEPWPRKNETHIKRYIT